MQTRAPASTRDDGALDVRGLTGRVALEKLVRGARMGGLGLPFLGAIIAAALLAPLLAPHDPIATNLPARNTPPFQSLQYLLGTDPLGRDVLSRLLHGASVSLLVGGAAVILPALVGVTLGLLAGYVGGWLDAVIMRVVDIQLGLPFLVLAIVVASVLGPGLWNVVLVLTLVSWVYYARVVRGEVLSLREQEYATAAIVVGCSHARILMRHMLPNVAASILVLSTFQVARMVIAESSLSFLGLGVVPPTPSWGGMVADGRNYLATSWWISTLPGLAIVGFTLAVNMFGESLRDALDPTRQDAP